MTDKTIINGVDVSECDCLNEWKHCDICHKLIKTIEGRTQCVTEPDLRCEMFPNCHFKQLHLANKRIEELEEKLSQIVEYCELVKDEDPTAEYDARIIAQQIKQIAQGGE